ncbi:ABC transporter ATP-binding protein [Candidatus Bathyarchaeota archaeon]|nr:ABC transporter ATP-binding protein [Candidatus Bathyarchaeota archaeon]
MALLRVEGLKTYFKTMSGYVKAVDGVSFEVEGGKATGLAGESGCGKTTVALSILRILPFNGEIRDGKIMFKGRDLLKLDEDEVREEIRWKEISIVFQGAMNALNPVYTVADQMVEAIMVHEPDVTRKEALERCAKLMELVGIDPSRINNYPHEFSGGMRQRAMIAMALACNPSILIADEPSTALDVIVAAQVLKLLKELKMKLNLGMILITHDLSIIAELCEKTAIMYAGKIVEYGDVVAIFKEPLHPYTQGLISAFPNITGKRQKLVSIPGAPPDLLAPPPGCRFHPRCNYAKGKCKIEEPAFIEISKGHYVACHKVESEFYGKKW